MRPTTTTAATEAVTYESAFAGESPTSSDPLSTSPDPLSTSLDPLSTSPDPLSTSSDPLASLGSAVLESTADIAFAPSPSRANHTPSPHGGVPGRRTVTIRGQVARPASRQPRRTVRERAGARPDRIAMWAVLLGFLLLLVAATSSHAAVIHALGSLH